MYARTARLALLVFALSLVGRAAQAGPIFITGHDPDFHAAYTGDPPPAQLDAKAFLTIALKFVLGASWDTDTNELLWVESTSAPPDGHLHGYDSLPLIGLTGGAGGDFTIVDGAGFTALSTTDLNKYKAIGVASSFGAMFTGAELDAMVKRKPDIAAFLSAGGGLFASAECKTGATCDSSNLAGSLNAPYSYLPFTLLSIPTTAGGFTLTPFGASLGLTSDEVNGNDPGDTHNLFDPEFLGGLSVVDYETTSGAPATLASPVPEPGTLTLVALGALGALRARRRRIGSV